MASQVFAAKEPTAKAPNNRASKGVLSPHTSYSNETATPGAGVKPLTFGDRVATAGAGSPPYQLPWPMQAKLEIGAVDDPLEREADRVSEHVMRAPDPVAVSGAGGGNVVRRKCAACAEDEEHEKISRKESSGTTALDGTTAPPIVREVLRSPGQPLDAVTRGFFEPRFGHDFGRVRVHDDSRAADSARAVGARAYTVNSDIVFAGGEYRPRDYRGRQLLAHELTHTIQQSGSPSIRRAIPDGATTPMAGRDPLPGLILRRVPESCSDLLNPAVTEAVPIAEKDVQGPLSAQIPGSVRELPIPMGSFAPYREKRFDPGQKGAGTGKIDIALTRKPLLEILEVKHADFVSAAVGLDQLANYVEKGNREENADWRAGLDVKTIVPMPTSRFTGSHVRATGSDEPVTLRWCNPGLIVYKAVREQDRDLFLCTARDQGKIDAFLKPKLHRGFDIVDEYIDKTVGPKIEAAISSMPLGKMLEKIIKNPAGRKMLEKALPGSSVILDQLDVKTLGDLAEKAIGSLGPAIRAVAMDFKRRLIDAVRNYLHDQMMTMLQQELNALCATVTVLTMEELLKKFRDNLPKYFGEAVGVLAPALAAKVATELLAEAAEGVLTAIAVACGIVFAVLAALELGAAALVAAAAEAAEAVIAAVIRAVAAAFASGGLMPLLTSNTDTPGGAGQAQPVGETTPPSARV